MLYYSVADDKWAHLSRSIHGGLPIEEWQRLSVDSQLFVFNDGPLRLFTKIYFILSCQVFWSCDKGRAFTYHL